VALRHPGPTRAAVAVDRLGTLSFASHPGTQPEPTPKVPHPHLDTALRFAPDGNKTDSSAAAVDGTYRLWDAATGKVIPWRLGLHRRLLRARPRFSTDGKISRSTGAVHRNYQRGHGGSCVGRGWGKLLRNTAEDDPWGSLALRGTAAALVTTTGRGCAGGDVATGKKDAVVQPLGPALRPDEDKTRHRCSITWTCRPAAPTSRTRLETRPERTSCCRARSLSLWTSTAAKGTVARPRPEGRGKPGALFSADERAPGPPTSGWKRSTCTTRNGKHSDTDDGRAARRGRHQRPRM